MSASLVPGRLQTSTSSFGPRNVFDFHVDYKRVRALEWPTNRTLLHGAVPQQIRGWQRSAAHSSQLPLITDTLRFAESRHQHTTRR